MHNRANQMRAVSNDSGMTLLETLVVLVVISLTYAFVVPSGRTTSRGLEIRVVAQNMTSHLRVTRALAVARGAPFGITFDVANFRYTTEPDGKTVQIPSNFKFDVTAAEGLAHGRDAARIIFFPDGSSSGGTVRLERDGQVERVGVEWLTGIVNRGRTP
jgi:general secretion pathway protein H